MNIQKLSKVLIKISILSYIGFNFSTQPLSAHGKEHHSKPSEVEEDNHKNLPNPTPKIENSPTESIEKSINSESKNFDLSLKPSEFLFLLLIINPFLLHFIKKHNII